MVKRVKIKNVPFIIFKNNFSQSLYKNNCIFLSVFSWFQIRKKYFFGMIIFGYKLFWGRFRIDWLKLLKKNILENGMVKCFFNFHFSNFWWKFSSKWGKFYYKIAKISKKKKWYLIPNNSGQINREVKFKRALRLQFWLNFQNLFCRFLISKLWSDPDVINPSIKSSDFLFWHEKLF